jgi:precorrin-2 dehydrogenase / sirohydrochlorin ferrochelatase
MYPVVLRIEGRRCLVVGGGPVAARKAAELARCGALVTVVAPDIDPAIEDLANDERGGTVQMVRRPYLDGEAADYRLVVTATGLPVVDRTVAADAEAAGVWVNSADDGEHCTFLLPSVHRDGSVSIAVSTGGASPALATRLRREVAETLGDKLGALAELLGEARHRLMAEGRPTTSVDWAAILDGPLPELVRGGDIDGARALLAEVTRSDPTSNSRRRPPDRP